VATISVSKNRWGSKYRISQGYRDFTLYNATSEILHTVSNGRDYFQIEISTKPFIGHTGKLIRHIGGRGMHSYTIDAPTLPKLNNTVMDLCSRGVRGALIIGRVPKAIYFKIK
jgi:hypothetical protein